MVVEVFFSFFHFLFWYGFWFWSLVFYCRVTRVARGVLLWTLGWVGLGLGLYTTWGKVLPSTGLLQVHVTFFFIDEMGGGMEGRAAASGRFLLEIENRQKSATVGLGWFLFCFYEVGWYLVLPYLTLPLS